MTVAQPKRRWTEPLASIVFSTPWAYLAEMAMEMRPEVEDLVSFLYSCGKQKKELVLIIKKRKESITCSGPNMRHGNFTARRLTILGGGDASK